eukprot:PhM_4_TR2382/c0_g2_i1/m.10458
MPAFLSLISPDVDHLCRLLLIAFWSAAIIIVFARCFSPHVARLTAYGKAKKVIRGSPSPPDTDTAPLVNETGNRFLMLLSCGRRYDFVLSCHCCHNGHHHYH